MRQCLVTTACALLVLISGTALAAYSQPASSINAGGGYASSSNYTLLASIGQSEPLGPGTSANYKNDPGLLPALGGLRILYPVITAFPGTLSFTLVSGNSANQPLSVANVGGSTLTWGVAKNNPAENWFSISPTTGTGDASVTVTANAAGLTAGTYTDTLTISGQGIFQTVQVQLGLTVMDGGTYRLTLTLVSDTPAKGGGAIHSDKGGIACTNTGSNPAGMSGTCFADFAAGTTVTLMQTPDSNSTLATWSPAGCGTNENCQVVMNGDKPVTATFPYAFMARVNSSQNRYDSLTQAYAAAAASDKILARDVTFIENLILGANKVITLSGGMSPSYTPLNSRTILQGTLTLKSGALVVDRLVIK